MVRKWKIFISSAAVLTVVLSCSKVKPSYNRENLKATWVADVYDGVTVDPDRWTVQTFDDKGTLALYGIRDIGDGNRTWDRCSMSYEAYCCDMSYSGNIKGFLGIPVSAMLTREYAFGSSKDSLVTLELTSETLNGEKVFSDHNILTMRKLIKSYSAADSLVGIWQTFSRDEEKFESWRLLFESTGRFILSVQSSSGSWNQIGEGTDSFSLYSDFITLTVKDNPYLGTEEFTDVAVLTNIIVRPKSSFMHFDFDGHSYILTYVSSLD